MKTYFSSLTLLLLLIQSTFAQKIVSGPMLGYQEVREVLIWAQTDKPAELALRFKEKGNKTWISIPSVKSEADKAHSVKLIAAPLEPGRSYEYQMVLNGKAQTNTTYAFKSKVLWQFRTPAPDFSFLAGSCLFVNDSAYDRPGKPYGGEYEILEQMNKVPSDFMLWLGDNTYLREVDWSTKTGVNMRYSHTRQLPQLQNLLASRHHYATWDDHDFGPNDGDRSWPFKSLSRDAFNQFWGNPNTGMAETGVAGVFEWSDCLFILGDDRWNKSPNDMKDREQCVVLGKKQIDWMVDLMVYNNRAPFKFVCLGSQVLNPFRSKENLSNCQDELSYLLKRIEQEKIKGVIFLSGDRHHTELTRYDRGNLHPLYDLTVSPLTSSSHNANEPNQWRVPQTLVNERNYAHLKVSGPKEARELKISIFNNKNEEKWSQVIKASDLEEQRGK